MDYIEDKITNGVLKVKTKEQKISEISSMDICNPINKTTCNIKEFLNNVTEGVNYYKKEDVDKLIDYLNILQNFLKEDLKPLVEFARKSIESILNQSEQVKIVKYAFDQMPTIHITSGEIFDTCGAEVVKLIKQ